MKEKTTNTLKENTPFMTLTEIYDTIKTLEKNAPNALWLYMFYYETAKKQKTNIIKCTNDFVAKGLNWNIKTVIKYKTFLMDLEIIKNVVRKNKNKKGNGYYVKLRINITEFIEYPDLQKKRGEVAEKTKKRVPKIVKKAQQNKTEYNQNKPTKTLKKTQNGDTKIWVDMQQTGIPKLGTQMLSSNNTHYIRIPTTDTNDIITHNFNKLKYTRNNISSQTSLQSDWKNKNNKYLPFANRLKDIVQMKKNIKVSTKSVNAWANTFRQLHEIDGVKRKRIRQVLSWYSQHYMDDFVPVAESGAAFRSKFFRIEDAIERHEQRKKEIEARNNTPIPTYKHSVNGQNNGYNGYRNGYMGPAPLKYKEPIIV